MDGKRGINHWKRKTYFQTEKHGNVLLTTCCMEICNKSYQIQRKKENVAFILASKSIGERYRPSHASCHVHVTLPWPGHGSLSSLHVCTLNIIPTVQAHRKCVHKYFGCKRTLAIVTYMYVDQFSVQSSQRAIQARHSLHSIHAIWGQLALQRTRIIQSRSAGDVAMAYWSCDSLKVPGFVIRISFVNGIFVYSVYGQTEFPFRKPFETEFTIFPNGKGNFLKWENHHP